LTPHTFGLRYALTGKVMPLVKLTHKAGVVTEGRLLAAGKHLREVCGRQGELGGQSLAHLARHLRRSPPKQRQRREHQGLEVGDGHRSFLHCAASGAIGATALTNVIALPLLTSEHSWKWWESFHADSKGSRANQTPLEGAEEADNLRRAGEGLTTKLAAESNKEVRKSTRNSKQGKQDAMAIGRPLPGGAYSKSR